MSLTAFYPHINDLVESIDDCKKKERILPCLTLLYSGMDVMASLDCEPGELVQTIFTRWVDSYLLKDHPLGCTAIDLYAARCGIVHTFTPNSKLYERGQAKRIAYAWGLGKAEDLKRAGQLIGYGDWLSIHLSDLIKAFRHAIANPLEHIEVDQNAKSRFERATRSWFATTDRKVVATFLKVDDEQRSSHSTKE